MPAFNLEAICQVCQEKTHVVSAVDLTSMLPTEQFDAAWRFIEPKGWAQRQHQDPRIKRYFVCPACLAKQAALEVALLPFSKTTRCPKCGDTLLYSSYKTGQDNGALVSCEHIERRCNNCSFKFPQRPLDAF